MTNIFISKRFQLVGVALSTAMIPFSVVAQGLPPLNIELKQHEGITIRSPREPNFFERLLDDTTAVTIIIVAIAFAVGFIMYQRKNS